VRVVLRVPGRRRGLVATVLLSVLAAAACGPALTPLPPASAPRPRPVEPTGPAPTLAARPAPSGPLGDGVTEADLDALWARQLMVPVDGVVPAAVRNDYEARRGNRLHLALDLLAPRGTPVLAADDGVVGRLGTTPVGGNIIYATDPDQRFVYYYAHLDRHARGLAVGDRVRKGQVIGYVGTTGNAPANTPHLHFQVMTRGAGRAWWDGPPINPYPYLVEAGAAIR
jgi:murein DD-endopeptidase MepM/ murein hydrolase activator NlpD